MPLSNSMTGTPGNFSRDIPELTQGPAHPDLWAPIHQQLADNDADLDARAIEAKGRIDNHDSRLEQIEDLTDAGTSQALVAYAMPVVAQRPEHAQVYEVVSAVAGDDSIDVQDSAGLVAGQHLVLRNGTDWEIIRLDAVLSSTRIRATGNLVHSYPAGSSISRWDEAEGIFFSEEIHQRMSRVVIEGATEYQVRYWHADEWVDAEPATDVLGGYFLRYGPNVIRVDVAEGQLTRMVVVSMSVIDDQSIPGAAWRAIAVDGYLALEEV
jgi:hypothetical protein